ncbi:MAG: PxxKW family cysteine-rich protein [bacterium]|nr:PxxKW family cysteine-rich protein [bacterium]
MSRELVVRIGKETIMKNPCVGECAGCPKQFKPTPYEGKTYCEAYPWPAVKWSGKICPFMYKPVAEKEQKLNPVKASRRRVSQVSVATGSKESRKK